MKEVKRNVGSKGRECQIRAATTRGEGSFRRVAVCRRKLFLGIDMDGEAKKENGERTLPGDALDKTLDRRQPST
ncbi:hypothetical protein R70006_03795 [Paraburkholderia domus]|uniref:hypothetical protein n=1 Tax=Paraburkholderia domus TaxID=2793075 RepID=UPI001912B178|nr:hypothetical protein [Paraburkholderia domus]MBK5047260.1 hypothetical protein [Burkholderia sp. R-70006]CAE6767647.1 hypothetical protein R70006_03795 [Paraburkholderia domus]